MKRTFAYLLLIVFLYTGCAVPGTLTGGDDDTQAPRLVQEKSTKSMQTNFVQSPIELTFDEWVKLGSTGSIIVSPPMKYKPKLKIKGKTVVFNFDPRDTLIKDVTYAIDFGKSIVDITKGNAAKDIRFIFSTGDYIDSLKFSGMVSKPKDLEKDDVISILLYKEGPDSLVTTQRSIYKVTVEENGRYEFNNIKEGRYNAYGIEDKNSNGFYDTDEYFGFLNEPISITDSTKMIDKIVIFKPQMEQTVLDEDFGQKGMDVIEFSENIDSLEWSMSPEPSSISAQKAKNTLTIWHNQEDTINYKIILKGLDTLKVRKHKRKNISPLSLVDKKVTSYQADVAIKFTYPITGIDTSKIIFVVDSGEVAPKPIFVLDSLDERGIILKSKLDTKKEWTLAFSTGGIKDFWGIDNKDSLSVKIAFLSKDDLSNMTVFTDSLDTTSKQLICKVLQEEKVIHREVVNLAQKNKSFVCPGLEGGDYAIEVILDDNENKQWDTGDFASRRQPEEIIQSQSIKVRKGWDVEFDLRDLFKKKKKEVPSTEQALPSPNDVITNPLKK